MSRAHHAKPVEGGSQPPSEHHPPFDFTWSATDEPHATRRKTIIATHDDVLSLNGVVASLKWKIIFSVGVQVGVAWLAQELSWPLVVLMAYTLGGIINHSLALAMHEVSHFLAFRHAGTNKVFGIFSNLPLTIPAFIMFKRYHNEHHKFQGEDAVDTDVPTMAEVKVVGNNTFMKVIWLLCQPVFYAFRPIIVFPKTPGFWEFLNWACVIAFDYAVYHYCGVKGICYLLFGTLLGMGLHPMAGHFVAEHYTWVDSPQETFSYYGPLNWFTYNVGYHNEHHDFPYVAGTKLPVLRSRVPEMYDEMPMHSSWVKVILRYIFDPKMGPFARVKRRTITPEFRAKLDLTTSV